jgi:3-oxoacyl-[acyl-carrier protein] reductase
MKGKRALVFASSEGLGKAVARALCEAGARVIISSRSSEKLSITAKEIGAEDFITCDLLQKGAARQLTKTAIERLGGLDILVLNAGGPPVGLFKDISTEQWESSFQSLFMSVVESLNEAIPEMARNNWGRILAITSVAAKEPIPNLTVSSALRAGVHGLINAVSKQIGAQGITINALMPTFTATERLRELRPNPEELVSSIPVRRLGHPDELGKLAEFLLSEHAGFITGQAIGYDGGSLAGI